MPEKTKFLIVDDHPIIGVAMELFLNNNFRNVELTTAEGGKEALKVLGNQKFDLVILDANLPDSNVLSLIPNIFSHDAHARILIFTMFPENVLAKRLFSMNISGFLSKNSHDDEILKAIKTILNGGKYISKDFSDILISDFLCSNQGVNPFEELSNREYQIMLEMLKGKTAKEISNKLHLHNSSVSTYRQRVYEKVRVDNNIDLFKKAQLFGILD